MRPPAVRHRAGSASGSRSHSGDTANGPPDAPPMTRPTARTMCAGGGFTQAAFSRAPPPCVRVARATWATCLRALVLVSTSPGTARDLRRVATRRCVPSRGLHPHQSAVARPADAGSSVTVPTRIRSPYPSRFGPAAAGVRTRHRTALWRPWSSQPATAAPPAPVRLQRSLSLQCKRPVLSGRLSGL